MRHDLHSQYNNVVIRQLRFEDIESLRGWRNDPSNTLYLRKIPFITTEMQSKWFEKYLNDETEYVFAIEEILSVNGIVGSLAIYNIENDRAEIGKILVGNSKAHGLHVCSNAIIAASHIAKKELLIHELYLHVYADNIPAVKSYLRAGFSIEEEYAAENGMNEYLMRIIL